MRPLDIDEKVLADQAKITKLRLRILETGGPAYMVAARCGFSPSRMSEYILGRREIPVKHLVPLCDVLKCEPEDVVGWVE